MLTRHSGDLLKSRSNHWFFSHIPQNGTISNPRQDAVSVADNDRGSYWSRYGYYLAFLSAALLALGIHITVVLPTHEIWLKVHREAFGFQHVMLASQHERLARKFHLKAQFDTIHGYHARIKAAHGEYDSRADAQNATKVFLLAKKSWEEEQNDEQEAKALGEKANEEHSLYLEYLKNASVCQQRAEVLQEKAQTLANQSAYYQQIVAKYSSKLQKDKQLEDSYLFNATMEGQLAENITQAEEEKEEKMWVCRWNWSKKYVCGVLGGYTALGDAETWREKQEEDYKKAMDMEQQVQLEQAKAMVASTKAAVKSSEARYDRLKAEEMQNTTVIDEIQATKEHMLELRDLQHKLEALQSAHEHLQETENYQTLHVKLAKLSRKEDEDAHGQFELGSTEIEKGKAEQVESEQEYDLAMQEAAKQAALVKQANKLLQQLRLCSFMSAAFALVALIFFLMACVSTSSLSLGHHVKTMVVAVSVAILRHWEGRRTDWEDRSILGDHLNRNSLRQISHWFHHGLCFLVVAGIHGAQLSCFFEVESIRMRGEIVLNFAVTAGMLDTLLFQAIPHASVLPALNREYFRNIAIRFVSSTCCFTIQMILLLILFGQDSTWIFHWIKSLHRFYLGWVMLLIITASAHMWLIEYPHTVLLDRNNGSAMSDVTFGGEITLDHSSTKTSLLSGDKSTLDEEAASPQRNFANNETESLLTVSRAEAPAPPSIQSQSYSTIALTAASAAASNPTFSPSPALQRLYEVSMQDEFFRILAHIEFAMFLGSILIICASLTTIAPR